MRKILFASAATVCLLAGSLSAGEKKLMHCFAFSTVDNASEADWNAFYKATDQLPSKIKGISHVWYGKLTSPLSAGGPPRQFGVCMEMTDAAARQAYGSAPFHADWEAAYSKVRQPGTTTFDFMGQ